jgi:hypothetical protein
MPGFSGILAGLLDGALGLGVGDAECGDYYL